MVFVSDNGGGAGACFMKGQYECGKRRRVKVLVVIFVDCGQAVV